MNKRKAKKKDRVSYVFSIHGENCKTYKQLKHFRRHYKVNSFPRFRTYIKEFIKNF